MRTQTVASAFVALVLAGGALQTPAGAQGSDKAAEILAAARKAIGDAKLESLKTFSAQAAVTRNVGQMQMNSDVELFVEMPDKYLRSDAASGGPVNFSSNMGFNGDRSLSRMGSTASGGQMVFRMGPNGPLPDEKPTPEQAAEMNRISLRAARHEIARFTLGWFAMAHPAVKPEYSYAGEAESADGKADVIDVKGEDGFAARLFIDQVTHLPLMLTYQGPKRVVMTGGPGGQRMTTAAGAPPQGQAGTTARPLSDEERKKLADGMQKQIETMRNQPPQLVEYRVYFADWSEVDGIRFPLKMQRAVEGTAEEEWTITKVKVNPKIDGKKFQAPS